MARRRLNYRLLAMGYGVMAAGLAALIAWIAIAGTPAPPAAASVTVPVEVEAAAHASDTSSPLTPQEALPPPPRMADNGMASARPFDAGDKRPRIAILITELGPSRTAAEAAIRTLPPEVSLAFLPFSNDTEALVAEAHAAGHEVLLDIPMEPATYPDDDPGPDALMTNVSDAENLRRFNWDLARANGYVGIVNFMGSRFTVAEQKLTPIFSVLHDHAMLIVDTKANPLTAVPGLARTLKVPYAVADETIDVSASRDAIDQNLAKLEDIATQKGKALGIAGTYPVTFERIAEWAKSLSAKGIALAPVSAVTAKN